MQIGYDVYMEVLRTIALYAEQKEMPFLVIGGHAMAAHNLERQTGDIDLLVKRTQKTLWKDLLVKMKYSALQTDDKFSRFAPDSIAAWPIDLMYVDDQTFEKLYADSSIADFGAATARVASPSHMVALKLHALKSKDPHRFAKDFGDVIGLLNTKLQNMSLAELKTICLKFADEEIYEKISKELKRS